MLIVDDDEKVREVLRLFLQPEGYKVIQAASAEEAMQYLELQPAVVLCDVHMPGANGLWLADQIRSLSPTTAMILATGDSRIPPAESLRRGIVSYLLKPFERRRVVSSVAEAVRWSEQMVARGVRRGPRRQLGPAVP